MPRVAHQNQRWHSWRLFAGSLFAPGICFTRAIRDSVRISNRPNSRQAQIPINRQPFGLSWDPQIEFPSQGEPRSSERQSKQGEKSPKFWLNAGGCLDLGKTNPRRESVSRHWLAVLWPTLQKNGTACALNGPRLLACWRTFWQAFSTIASGSPPWRI